MYAHSQNKNKDPLKKIKTTKTTTHFIIVSVVKVCNLKNFRVAVKSSTEMIERNEEKTHNFNTMHFFSSSKMKMKRAEKEN